MSYLVLARKSRPQTFDQVIGQRPVVKTLQNSLARNRVTHALIFSGVRGVGKTTLARLMAKAINCEHRDASNNPCNQCISCQEITNGSSLDLYEIDGASNRGIQEIRELKEKIRFLPTSAQYRIVIIDEVHMLTTEAFNALLKTLEEPPEHVYFMFATTEIHKIPITILSRCQQYELKRVAANDLADHFKRLIREEGKEIEKEALALIVREAAGSVRDGLSLLDQVLSFSESSVTTPDVIEVLGLIDREVLTNLTQALLNGDRSTAILTLEQIFRFGMDIKRFCTDLIGQFRTLLLCKINGCRPLIDLPDEEFNTFSQAAQNYSTETLHLKMNMLIEMVENIGRSSQPRLILETTFLKMIEAGNIVPVSQLLKKIDTILTAEDGERGKAAVASADSAQQEPVAKKTKTRPEPAQKKKEINPPGIEVIPLPEEPPEFQQRMPAPPPAPAPTATPTPKPAKRVAAKKDIRTDWKNFLAYVQESSSWMAPALSHITKIEEEGNNLLLHYDDAINCTLVRRTEHSAELKQFILDFYDKNLNIKFILPETEEKKTNSSSSQNIRHELMHDPLVIATAEIFRGTVGDIRVTTKK